MQGIHFDLDWLGLEDVGYRAFMAAASDVAAMGAHASHALCAWTLPASLTDADIEALARGVERASIHCACPVVGGNLAGGPLLTLTTSVLGALPGPALLRSQGREDDALFVTGPLGSARVGLARLMQSSGEAEDPFCRAFRAPVARLDIVDELRAVSRCAIDLSDGLLGDLSHICHASNTGAVVELDALPRLSDFAENCRELGLDSSACLLSGGEEYELLFSADARAVLPWAHRIGRLCAAGQGIVVRRADGQAHPLPAGFTHFGV